jgi:hypothetical protein
MKHIIVTLAVACFASPAFAGAPRVTTPADVYQQEWMWKAVQSAKADVEKKDQNVAFSFPTRPGAVAFSFPTRPGAVAFSFPTRPGAVAFSFPTRPGAVAFSFPTRPGAVAFSFPPQGMQLALK